MEKAVLASDLGLNPTTAGAVIRINLPALTEERRKELSKLVHNEGENTKIAIRNISRDAIGQVKDLLKEKEISEDDERRGGDESQKHNNPGTKDVNAHGRTKARKRWCSKVQNTMDAVTRKNKQTNK